LCCREVEPRLGPQGRPGTTRIDDQPQCTRRRTQRPATTEHVGSALRMREVPRSSQSLAIFRTSHLSARTGGEK
jgi:hypothetical protein